MRGKVDDTPKRQESFISSTTWTYHFQNLNLVSDGNEAKIKNLNIYLADLEKEKSSKALYFKITNYEIFKAIKNFKKWKGRGYRFHT